ncbi:hypothetical protein LOZ66_006777, partial [Ophidiomyces ophidiicola]
RTNTNTNHEYDPFVGANPSSSPMSRVHDSNQLREINPWRDIRTGDYPAILDNIHTNQYSMLADIDTSMYSLFGDGNLDCSPPDI